MKTKILKIFISSLFIGVLLFNLGIARVIDKENDLLLKDLFSLTQANAESGADVDCQDVPYCGAGPFYARICVKNNEVYCKWDYYTWPNPTTGKCHF